ncbi:VCBS repeat-containing protein, partial [Saprospiraceae bacterium]|nr:VCBS repeat-containing protein [Saprospiraceae bacterium]
MKYILWTIILLFGHIAISQDLSFTNVSEEAGLDYTHNFSITAPPMTFIIGGGSATGDIDNDGYLDLFFTLGDEQNGVLMHNNGDGTF